MVTTKRLASLGAFLGFTLVFGYFSLATVRGANYSGSDAKNYISASPQTCTIPVGQTSCTVTVSWGTTFDYPWNSYTYRVIVRETGGLFAQAGPTGSQAAPWVTTTPVHMDLYYLSGNTWVNSGMSTEIRGISNSPTTSSPSPNAAASGVPTSPANNLPVGSTYITAGPNPCFLQSDGKCSSLITWQAPPGGGSYEIKIKESPGSVFASSLVTGSQWASWINASGATFELYKDGAVIDRVFVRGIPAASTNLGTGLISYYGLDEASGNVANSITSINPGGVVGTTVVDGKINKARSFNTASDKIDFGPAVSLAPIFTLSASAWVKATSFPESLSEVVGRGSSWWLQTQDGKPQFKISVSNNWQICQSPTALPLGTWNHLAGTYDYTNLRLYVNGVLVKTCPVTGVINNSGTSTYIGSAGVPTASGVSQWNGIIDEVGIWNRALSDQEVGQLAAGQVPPTSTSNGSKVSDIDGNGTVDIFDFNAYVGYFRSGDSKADLNGENGINILDFNLFVEKWRNKT